MKSALTRTVSIFGACAMLAAISFPGPARGQRTAECVQRPVEQEPLERLPAPAERAEQLEVQELSEQELATRPDILRVPRACAGLKPVVGTHDAADNFSPPGDPFGVNTPGYYP